MIFLKRLGLIARMGVLLSLLTSCVGVRTEASQGGAGLPKKCKDDPKANTLPIEASANVVGKTQYLAQGARVIKTPVIQGDVTVSSPCVHGLSANVWTNYDPKTNKFEEIDISCNYDFGLTENIRGNVGYAHYDFSNGDLGIPDAQDLSVGVYTTNWPVDFSLTAFKVSGEKSGHGIDYCFGMSKSFNLVDKLSLSLGSETRYNDHHFTDEKGFAVSNGTANLNYDLGKDWSASFGYLHQIPLDKDTFGDTFQETGVWSLGFSKSF